MSKLIFHVRWGDNLVNDHLAVRCFRHQSLSWNYLTLEEWRDKTLYGYKLGIAIPTAQRLANMWSRMFLPESRHTSNWVDFHSLNIKNKVLPDVWFIPDDVNPYIHVLWYPHTAPFVNYIGSGYGNIPTSELANNILDFFAEVRRFLVTHRRQKYQDLIYKLDNIFKSSVKNYSVYYR